MFYFNARVAGILDILITCRPKAQIWNKPSRTRSFLRIVVRA